MSRGIYKTKFTVACDIKAPFMQGGMQNVALPELVAAVANAGALGTLNAFNYKDPEDFRQAVRKTKSLTSEPFCVNFTMLPSINPPDYAGFAKVAVEEGIRIFETSGPPQPVLPILRSVKSTIIHKCISFKHAKKAEEMGMDFASVEGLECAGHPGEEGVSTLVLLTKCASELKIPFIASGGFSDARGIAAAFALGAQGVNMGSRWMATVECPIHENIKKTIVNAGETDTSVLMRPLNNSARVYRNNVAKAVEKIEQDKGKAIKFSDIQEYVMGSKGRQVYITGNPDAGVWSLGQSASLVHDIPTCKELVARLEKGSYDILTQTPANLFHSGSKL